ncbi:MAG: PEGA domain-containing protein [Myxococcota bacterium]
MRHCLIASILFVAALSTMADVSAQVQPQAPAKVKVVVLELNGLGLHGRDAELPKALGTYLRNSVATIDGLQLLPPVDVQLAVQASKNPKLIDCAGGAKCATDIGKLVGADRVIFGGISAFGEAYSLNARVIETATGKEVARHQATFAGSRDALIPEIRLAAYKLLAPERILGSLMVQADVDGVSVEIDGEPRGMTPLSEPIKNLAPGKHTVVLKRSGYSQFQQELTIRPFETAKLQLKLDRPAKAEQ